VQKGLIVVHREESADDFKEIAQRIKAIDPNIKGAMVSEWIFEDRFPQAFFEMPLLVVYMCNTPQDSPEQFLFPNATNLMVFGLTKLEEYEHFKQHNIPCLPIEKFKWGMELDLDLYGEWVALKPENIQSTGKDVNMVPTRLISTLKLSDFPEDHLIHKDGYLVQKFVKTGKSPAHYRVLMFCGEILLIFRAVRHEQYPVADKNLNILLSKSVASNLRGGRDIQLVANSDVSELAMQVSSSLPNSPILGIDIIHDTEGNLYVLEINSGGNTWAFSNKPDENFRSVVGLSNIIEQYGAWDRAAEALVRKVNELAI
jgi:hypothetical protein